MSEIERLQLQLLLMRAQQFPASECWKLWCRIERLKAAISGHRT